MLEKLGMHQGDNKSTSPSSELPKILVGCYRQEEHKEKLSYLLYSGKLKSCHNWVRTKWKDVLGGWQ